MSDEPEFIRMYTVKWLQGLLSNTSNFIQHVNDKIDLFDS